MWMAYYLLGEIKISADEVRVPAIQDTGALFDRILGLIYVAIAAISLFYIVRGALLFVTHGGDATGAKEARETVLYAIVALVGSSLVFTLINFVLNVKEGTPQ